MDTVKRKSDVVMDTAKDVAQDAPNKIKAAAENPQETKQTLLHKPFVKAALPFVNGGLAGKHINSRINPLAHQSRDERNNMHPTN